MEGSMKFQGQLLNWHEDKGFGFVEPNGGGTRAFVHIKAFLPGSRRPVTGDVIIYELVTESNNRHKAINIQFARDAAKLRKRPKAKSGGAAGIVFIALFCCGLLASTYLEKLPLVVVGLYAVMSVLTFIAYAIDKSAAQNGRWRTKESTLHLFSILGGWPGAYYAQRKLRHKSKKTTFKTVYWVTVFLNLGGLFWLHTKEGTNFLNALVKMIFL
jgi:uncharacterized membrane protein YsdA (DUF1294 family)/cold shock CspA family protein